MSTANMANTAKTAPTILVVDDDPAIIELLRRVLSDANYHVVCASDANEGLHLALKYAPILAILDIHMPQTDGLILAKNLSEETSVPFVFLSTENGHAEIQQASALGAAGFLMKPINAEQILPFITISLARAQEMERLRAREVHLQSQVESARLIGTAVGLLMGKHPINEKQAFQRLHDYARAHRQKITDVAKMLVTSQENVNLM